MTWKSHFCDDIFRIGCCWAQVPVWLLKATRSFLKSFQWARDAADRLVSFLLSLLESFTDSSNPTDSSTLRSYGTIHCFWRPEVLVYQRLSGALARRWGVLGQEQESDVGNVWSVPLASSCLTLHRLGVGVRCRRSWVCLVLHAGCVQIGL